MGAVSGSMEKELHSKLSGLDIGELLKRESIMNAAIPPAIVSLIISLLIGNNPAFAQGQLGSPSIIKAGPTPAMDLRIPELVQKEYQDIDVGDGFRASRVGNSVSVTIPGAYVDTLSASMAEPLSNQLAAVIFVKIANTQARNASGGQCQILYWCKGSKTGWR